MKNQKHTDREVDKTLASLDGIERATTDDFFYSRVTARLEKRNKAQESSGIGVAVAAAAVFIMLVLNLISISQYPPATDSTATTRTEVVDQLASDYQSFDNNYYQTFEEE
ncbi:hypothetical protein [Gracilimonas sp. BCB1]|uniref:hypothetical protein n=1 Tax=Gracilimonas sp. BCB1 TaxID=3152362 RepID=UPI0032D97D94